MARQQQSLKVRAYVWLSWFLFVGGLIGWAATHVLMFVTKPEGATSWWAHVLIGISWLAIVVAALGVIVTADVRSEQENGDGPSGEDAP